MRWVSVKETPLPKDGGNYVALFKGQFCIIAWDDSDEKYHMAWMPNTYDKVKVLDSKEDERKLTHWAVLFSPEGY